MIDITLGKKIQKFVYNIKLFFKKTIPQSHYQRSVFILGGGSLLAQIIAVISGPIVTRLYSPSNFGVLAIFSSVLSIIVVTASLRYEFACPLEKEERNAANIFAVCISLLIATSIIFSLILYLANDKINTYFALDSIRPYFWLLILGFFGSGLYNIFNYWAIRQRDYSNIAYTKINQGISGSISKILMGLFSMGPLGLIISYLISQIAGINTFMKALLKKDKSYFYLVTFKDMKLVARQYIKFPLFSLPSSLFTTISMALPAIMLSSIYGLEVTGWYSLAFGILVLPGSIVTTSISQVYFGEVSKLIREESKELLYLFLSTIRKLALIGIPLIGIPAIIAPFIFPIIFGDVWREAGFYCLPLALMAYANFCLSPTTQLSSYGFNNWMLYWDLLRLSALIGGFYVAIYLKLSPVETLLLYSIIMTILYIIVFFMNIIAIKIKIGEFTKNA
jgi:O-antigen/teichoic acid export membrane protein